MSTPLQELRTPFAKRLVFAVQHSSLIPFFAAEELDEQDDLTPGFDLAAILGDSRAVRGERLHNQSVPYFHARSRHATIDECADPQPACSCSKCPRQPVARFGTTEARTILSGREGNKRASAIPSGSKCGLYVTLCAA